MKRPRLSPKMCRKFCVFLTHVVEISLKCLSSSHLRLISQRLCSVPVAAMPATLGQVCDGDGGQPSTQRGSVNCGDWPRLKCQLETGTGKRDKRCTCNLPFGYVPAAASGPGAGTCVCDKTVNRNCTN